MSVDDYSIVGKQYFVGGDYVRAIENFQKALNMITAQAKKKPDKFYLITNALGFAYEENLQFAEALECYQNALEFIQKKYGPESIQTISSLHKIKNCKRLIDLEQ